MPNAENGKQRGDTDNDSELNKSMVRWTRAVAVFTGLLFITSLVSDGIILKSLWDTEETQKGTQEQLRAFLSLAGIVESNGLDSQTGKPTEIFAVQIQNIGGTRTAWARAWTNAHYYEGSVPLNFDSTRPYDKLPDLQDTVVPPNQFLPLGNVGVPIESAKDAFERKGVIVVWGTGEYATIYDPKVSLPFSFCLLMVPVEGSAKQSGAETAAPGGPPPVRPIAPQPPRYYFTAQPYRAACNYYK